MSVVHMDCKKMERYIFRDFSPVEIWQIISYLWKCSYCVSHFPFCFVWGQWHGLVGSILSNVLLDYWILYIYEVPQHDNAPSWRTGTTRRRSDACPSSAQPHRPASRAGSWPRPVVSRPPGCGWPSSCGVVRGPHSPPAPAPAPAPIGVHD